MRYIPAGKGHIERKKDYSKEIIFGLEEFEAEGHLLQTVIIPANTKQREHYHKKQTEVFYILKGSSKIYVNGLEFPANPGDSFIIEPGDKHYVWNETDKPFKLVVFKINLPDTDETVWS